MMRLALLLGCLLSTVEARAFSDPALFAAPARSGGGGELFFTGSPVDGYDCSVCHRGGPEPRMQIVGLPESFEPGAVYDLAILWQDPSVPHGVQLELIDERGASPVVELNEQEASAGARCDSTADGTFAAYLLPFGTRKIVGARDCRASELRFRFVAPDAARLAFAAAAVRSDGMGTSEGDGASSLRVIIPRRGLEGAEASGCAVKPAMPMDLSILLLLSVLARRRRGALFLLVCLPACYQPARSAAYEEVERDATPAFDASTTEAGMPLDAVAALLDATLDIAGDAGFRASRLVVRVRTSDYIGRYAPSNIGAIWIEDAQGRFIKTLARWARTRAMYLWQFQRSSAGDLTDAVTSATLDEHMLHTVTWDLTDRTRRKVPSSDYQVVMEMTDRDGSGPLLRIPFTYGDAPFTLMPDDMPQFKELLVRLE